MMPNFDGRPRDWRGSRDAELSTEYLLELVDRLEPQEKADFIEELLERYGPQYGDDRRRAVGRRLSRDDPPPFGWHAPG